MYPENKKDENHLNMMCQEATKYFPPFLPIFLLLYSQGIKCPVDQLDIEVFLMEKKRE
jgi:hypothetical protein